MASARPKRSQRVTPVRIADDPCQSAASTVGDAVVWDVGLLLLGLVTVVVGAEVFVRGSVGLARLWGMSSLWLGLTVVAVGTSAPEIALSFEAIFEGRVDMAVGNVVGSNIFNILLVLGASAAIAPLPAAWMLARIDLPSLAAISGLTWGLAAWDGELQRRDGVLLLFGMVAYVAFRIGLDRSRRTQPIEKDPFRPRSLVLSLLGVALGLVMLRSGSSWMVHASAQLAREFGVTERVIGLTILSTGTSLPEVATSLVAVAKGERELAVGNAIGSSLMNLVLVLGLTATFAPIQVAVNPSILSLDLPVMVATVVACLFGFRPGRAFGRVWGASFLIGYAVYLSWLLATG